MNYRKIFGKNFIGLFELLSILRRRYKHIPRYYSVMLSVDWEKGSPFYLLMLDFGKGKKLMMVDSNNGKVRKLTYPTNKNQKIYI